MHRIILRARRLAAAAVAAVAVLGAARPAAGQAAPLSTERFDGSRGVSSSARRQPPHVATVMTSAARSAVPMPIYRGNGSAVPMPTYRGDGAAVPLPVHRGGSGAAGFAMSARYHSAAGGVWHVMTMAVAAGNVATPAAAQLEAIAGEVRE